ncbi:hypothetical protein NL676_036249 [Syzygium grande]|nr:hypothetical protein NL676_036249 [Syzygium grande]
MAFDQSSVPMDLRPLNVARTTAEEPRIAQPATAARTGEGYFMNTAHEAGSPQSMPVFYPATVPDVGYGGLGYSNSALGVAAWYPHAPVRYGHMSVNPAMGFGYNPSLVSTVGGNAVDQNGNEAVPGFGQGPYVGNRIVSNAVDQVGGQIVNRSGSGGNLVGRESGNVEEQVSNDSGIGRRPHSSNQGSGSGVSQPSEEGGEDSVSGKKVKFLCSFGGKILPRPSDGMLRYVGGQTRIISVKRDVSFNELVQKMEDTYGQPVVIKYQLPDEDLDALVSVSCPDDLDNMMEEYEKLVERSSDGSAKIRLFLFSASELDSSGIQFGDLHSSGQRYVEAVNGIMDGMGGGITRKESIASATSTQNSDFSGNEAVDSAVPIQSDLSGPPSTSTLSPGGNLAASSDTSKLFFVDQNPTTYADDSSATVGIPVVKSGPLEASSLQPEIELEKSVPQRPLAYDMQQAAGGIPSASPYTQGYVDQRNHTDYVPMPPLMGFSNPHLLGTSGPVYTQQQFSESAVGGNSHQFISPVHMTMVPASSQVGLRPTVVQQLFHPQQTQLGHDGTSGQRLVMLPVEQNHNAYQVQAPPAMVGGAYGWHQVYPPGQDQRDSSTGHVAVSSSIYHSLRLEDNVQSRPMNRVMVTGTPGDGLIDPGNGTQPKVSAHKEKLPEDLQARHENQSTAFPRVDYPDSRKQGFVGNDQSPFGAFMGAFPESSPEIGVQQHFMPAQAHLKPEAMASKPVTADSCPVGGKPAQSSEHQVHESSKEYSRFPGVESRVENLDYSISMGPVKTIDKRMETLLISPPDMPAIVEHSKLPGEEQRKAEILKQKVQQNLKGDVFSDASYMLPQTTQAPISETSALSAPEVPYLRDFRPVEFQNTSQPPNVGIPRSNSQSRVVIQVEPEGVYHGNSVFSGVGLASVTEGISSSAPWNNDASIFQPINVPGDIGTINSNGRTDKIQDPSKSLFINQDPWNLNHDNHFPPPKPTKIALRKEGLGAKDQFLDNRCGKVGDLNAEVQLEDGVQQPFNNFTNYISSEQYASSKGSAEDLIKQELQNVAEGVAASVLQSALPSNPDLTVYEGNEPAHEAYQEKDVQQDADTEDANSTVAERVNFGFPVSDGIGRLQIIKNSDLEELRELGSGTYGTVYHGKWRGTDVAIKRINDRCFSGKPSEQERMRYDFWNEAIKLADLHHPNVVAFYGVVLDGPGGSVATVTEYMVNGSLRNALQKSERNLDKRKRLLIAMDVAFGMEYLHGKNIVHFDLKSDNLLVNLRDPHRPICKVGDLGLSKVKCQTLISGGVRGTLPWMAPELLNGSSSLVSEKVDVFSFGIVMWEILTGEEPYADLHYGAIIGGIVSNTLRPPVPESCDLEWRSLMERCWSAEPSERPSFTEIANELRSMCSRISQKMQNYT